MSDKVYDDVLRKFAQAGASMRCAEVKRLLETLGFAVYDKSRGNHKVFGHEGINSFKSGNYDCGHGSNPEVKKIYIKNIIKTIKLYEAEIKGFLDK